MVLANPTMTVFTSSFAILYLFLDLILVRFQWGFGLEVLRKLELYLLGDGSPGLEKGTRRRSFVYSFGKVVGPKVG